MGVTLAFGRRKKQIGYKAGSEITKDMSGGILQDITKGASILRDVHPCCLGRTLGIY